MSDFKPLLEEFRGRHYCQWFWKSERGVSGGRVPMSGAALERLVEAANIGKHNLYISLNPTRPCGIKARVEDVEDIEYILIDVDPIDSDGQIQFPGIALHDLFDEVYAVLGSAPGVYLDSGRGVQLWLRVRNNIQGVEKKSVEQSVSKLLRSINGRWQNRQSSCIDPSTSDLSRVARMPESVNWKTGRTSRISWIERGTIDLSQVLDMFPPDPIEVTCQANVNFKNLSDLLPHLNTTARTFIRRGQQSPGRHKAAFAAAKNLMELGLPAPETLGFVMQGAELCTRVDKDGRVVPYPLSERASIYIVDCAYGRK